MFLTVAWGGASVKLECYHPWWPGTVSWDRPFSLTSSITGTETELDNFAQSPILHPPSCQSLSLLVPLHRQLTMSCSISDIMLVSDKIDKITYMVQATCHFQNCVCSYAMELPPNTQPISRQAAWLRRSTSIPQHSALSPHICSRTLAKGWP